MNRAKSIFIGLYPMVAMGILGYAAWRLSVTRDGVAWAGPLLTTLPFMAFLSCVMLFKSVARTSGSFPALNALALGGTALSAYAVLGRGGDPLALGLSATGAICFAAYSVWYSRLGRPTTSRLAVGRPFPALELKKVDGGAFNTGELRGQPALIFFYRGNWCPLCMAQVKEVAARYRDLAQLGARVLLVSPQPHDNSVALAKRFNVPFDFLTDVGNEAARSLGIEMKNGLPMGMGLLGYEASTVYPTVVVLDATGVVRWLDQTDNYRVRPEPETFLPLLTQLAATRG